MPKYPIDLGKKNGECCPCPISVSGSSVHYPSLYLDWTQDYDLPESGEMVVRFVRTSKTDTVRKEGDETKENHSVCLDIKKIISVKADKPKTEDEDEESGEKALDRLRDEADEEEGEE